MNGETVIIYREEQKFTSWLHGLVYISMSLTVLFSIFALKKVYAAQGSSDKQEILIAVVVRIGVLIAIAALCLLLKLETEVRSEGLYV